MDQGFASLAHLVDQPPHFGLAAMRSTRVPALDVAQPPLVTGKGLLRSLDPSTGTISLLTPPSLPTGLTFADPGKGVLFWATAGGIQQYAPASGAATLILTPVGLGYQFALDAAYFYWIKGDGVFRWPRP